MIKQEVQWVDIISDGALAITIAKELIFFLKRQVNKTNKFPQKESQPIVKCIGCVN